MLSLYDSNKLPDNLGEWEVYPNKISWWIRWIHLSKYELHNSNSADYWKADVNYKIQLFPFSDV